MTDQTTQLLKAADPARRHTDLAHAELDLRAELDLQRIMSGTRPRRGPTRRLVLAGSAAAVGGAVVGAAAVGAAVVADRPAAPRPELEVFGRSPLRYTQHDKRPAREQLLDFAARVRKLSPETPGRVLHVKTTGFGYLVPMGKGRWIDDYRVDVYLVDGKQYTYAAGSVGSGPARWLEGVSSDPAVLAQQLRARQPYAEDTPEQLFLELENLMEEYRPQPAARAAILTLLADVPGISADGTTTDRAGRRAVGFSVKTDDTTDSLLFAPATGELLGYESVLTRNTRRMEHKLPATIESRTIVQRYVATLPR
ncbi:hypothetical protein [Kribbella sp. HUAS MG21]|uniref:CU044_5270 family protein n=1 Tax=Kribbella sp. HUAS MG21 TaxID=3160966 RepID=A0AAU7TJB6_9ACTN